MTIKPEDLEAKRLADEEYDAAVKGVDAAIEANLGDEEISERWKRVHAAGARVREARERIIGRKLT